MADQPRENKEPIVPPPPAAAESVGDEGGSPPIGSPRRTELNDDGLPSEIDEDGSSPRRKTSGRQ